MVLIPLINSGPRERVSAREAGFTLIELIAVMVIVGIIAVTASARFASTDLARLQASRDDLVAALFFAQQTAMARDNIVVTVSTGGVDVMENGSSITLHQDAYPLTFAAGVTAEPAVSFSYDKLGRTTSASITLTADDGSFATVTVDGSGYAHY